MQFIIRWSSCRSYQNRKGNFSLNVQAICNANLPFMDFAARWPGSVHDCTIFNSSSVKNIFERGNMKDGLLLGDSGYSLSPYLLTWLHEPRSGSESLYNESHIRSRNCVERMFGVWKRRFPALALGLRMQVQKLFQLSWQQQFYITSSGNDMKIVPQMTLNWHCLFPGRN